MAESGPRLYVCVTCRAGRALEAGEVTPGQRLHDALQSRIGEAAPFTLHSVACLASCERGCAAAIAAPGKWGYLLGHLSDAQADDLIAYGHAYAGAKTGTVMPSKRPASLVQAVLSRFPAPEFA